MITIEIKDTDPEFFVHFSAEQLQRVWMALERVGVDMVSETKGRLKWRYEKGKGLGGRATARLANSYNSVLTREGPWTVLTVGSGVKYAPYVEGYPKAPRRHYLSFATAPEFKVWLERHGVDVPDGAKGWMTGGEGATTPHLGPAANKVLPKAVNQIIAMSRR